MFFSNLQQMRRQCDLLLDLDQSMVEGILEDGHDWAQDHIAQNVPVPTSRDIHSEIAKFVRGELPMSGTNYLRQNNHYEKNEYDPLGTGSQKATLEEFFV